MICGCLLLGLVFACSARADEISDMKKQIADMQARIDQMEAQQKKVVAEEVNKAVEQKQAALPDSIKMGGEHENQRRFAIPLRGD